MTNVFKDSSFVQTYDSNRPLPPPGLVQTIQHYYAAEVPDENPWNCMIDIGCGSGLSTVVWFGLPFQQIVGFDVSRAQIELANKIHKDLSGIQFKVSPAETLPLSSNSVDLITCGQSFHYFNIPEFLKESQRILKPGGVLALFAYYFPTLHFVSSSNLHPTTPKYTSKHGFQFSTLLEEIHDQLLPEKYKLHRRSELIGAHYSTVDELSRDLVDLRCYEDEPAFTRILPGNGESIVNAMKSQAMYQAFHDQNPRYATEFLRILEDEVRGFGGTEDLSGIQVELHYHYFLVLARKPH